MINLQELRIGNWIEFSAYGSQFIQVDKLDNLEEHHYSYIPITEEWLVKFGFVKKEKTNLYLISIHKFNLKKMCVYLDVNDCTIAMVDYFSNLEKSELFPLNYKYVHQLQNLYFALTQTELEKNENPDIIS